EIARECLPLRVLDGRQVRREQDADAGAQLPQIITLVVLDLPGVRQERGGRMRVVDDLDGEVLLRCVPIEVAADEPREPRPVPLRAAGRVDADEAAAPAD